MYEESLDKEEAINAVRGKLDYTAIWMSLRHWGMVQDISHKLRVYCYG